MPKLDALLRDVLGGRTGTTLAKHLDVITIGELLRHYPRRYAERGKLTDLTQLQAGEQVTVMATVKSFKSRPMRQRRGSIQEVVVSDGNALMALVFFNQPYRQNLLQPGVAGLFAGKVVDKGGLRSLQNPEILILDGAGDDTAQVDEFAGSLIPIYPAKPKLTSWTISRCVKMSLDSLDAVPDGLPLEMLAEYGLMGIDAALRAVHRPEDRRQLGAALKRLKWDEALAVQLTLAQRRHSAAINPALPRPRKGDGIAAAFDSRLPFSLTDGQREIGATLEAELTDPHPMGRLLQGEVGSGKTIVALRAMLQVVDAGGQAALLAPTEVLAGQHLRTIEGMLGDLGQGGRIGGAEQATRVTLLTGSLGAAARRRALLEAASGEAGIVIGTHALIQDNVQFADLGLVVVDEQHRFGVEQRDALRYKNAAPPHVLVMTATPIPRTVAMTVFGDLETSVLSELPAGRAPITTSVVPADKPHWVDRMWQRIAEEVAAGRQAYVVCPRIGDESDVKALADSDQVEYADTDDKGGDAPTREMRGVLETAAMLAEGPLKGLRQAILHGRLPGEEKDGVMRAFAAGDIDVLVATTVIEVGVDVPNATVMVVLDADRFGVSQLHQLRGRIGRGGHPGLCLLSTQFPEGSPGRSRVDAVASTVDGFELARVDLEQRREGDVLGADQSGRHSHLKLLSLLRDEQIIADARAEAAALIVDDPELSRHPLLAAQVAELLDDERAEYLQKA
ncbi:MAG: ATP-dependent DNA helicase RecG [Jatrophihabitans sp.]